MSMNLSQEQKNALAVQYEPLVNKITSQFIKTVNIPWEDVKSMAWEGLAIAFETYDDDRSSMSFTQFAGFSIRNNILTCLDNELRTVKMSNYIQKQATESGAPLFNTVSIDQPCQIDDDLKPREMVMGLAEEEKFSDGDVFECMYAKLEAKFMKRDYMMFYKTFGLKGYDEMKGKDIAVEFGVSEGLVSQKIKKIIQYIRQDTELCEILANLVK